MIVREKGRRGCTGLLGLTEEVPGSVIILSESRTMKKSSLLLPGWERRQACKRCHSIGKGKGEFVQALENATTGFGSATTRACDEQEGYRYRRAIGVAPRGV